MSERISEYSFDLQAALALPKNVRFGTSSWTYPGWKGVIYCSEYRNEKDFNARCLSEYGAFPWFRSVGIDSSFYNPMTKEVLERYMGQLPETLRWIAKAWERLTIPRYPKLKRYGDAAGKDNSDFLNIELFADRVLEPIAASNSEKYFGSIVFQFPALAAQFACGPFLDQLEFFLEQLPKPVRYGVEIRNPELLVPRYFELLNKHRVAHCFNHWTGMPSLGAQMNAAGYAGGLAADFFVARILTPLGVSYENAVKLFAPYDRLQRANLEMRHDAVRLIRRAMERSIEVYVIVNNRSEGCAPITIDAIGRAVTTGGS